MTEQPNTAPQTDLERYYEALHFLQLAKPGTWLEQYWKKRVEDLESTELSRGLN